MCEKKVKTEMFLLKQGWGVAGHMNDPRCVCALSPGADNKAALLCCVWTERGETPCVTFMNKSFEGEDALGGVTLLQLGIVTGQALLRHTVRYSCAPSTLPNTWNLAGCLGVQGAYNYPPTSVATLVA